MYIQDRVALHWTISTNTEDNGVDKVFEHKNYDGQVDVSGPWLAV